MLTRGLDGGLTNHRSKQSKQTMATFQKDDGTLRGMVDRLISQYESNQPLTNVKLDLVFAFGEQDETTGLVLTHALTKNGVRALGITRKVNLKDRTKGLGDAEITIDGDWWDAADGPEKMALLDHELHHIVVTAKRDNLGRPILKLRKHDFEVGWFALIAKRHGTASAEQRQAKMAMDVYGQFFWPEINSALKGNRFSNLEAEEKPKLHETVTIKDRDGDSMTVGAATAAVLSKLSGAKVEGSGKYAGK